MSSLPFAKPATPLPPKIDKAGQNFLRIKKEYRIYDCRELAAAVARLPTAKDHLVAGFLPARSVNIMVGDSGIGKSPLGYQLALAIACGAPFLDMPTKRGKVLFIDYENSPDESLRILRQQCKNLGIKEGPHTLQTWSMQLNPLLDNIEEVVANLAPDLVIIDSLRSFNPGMESDNTTAIEQIRRLRVIAVEQGTAFLFVHHLRKGRAETAQTNLGDSAVMDWLSRAAGVRALINQTDVRLAVSTSRENMREGLVLRGHFRTRGEIGPFHLRRVLDEAGDPLGYARTSAPHATLDNSDQEAALHRLPASFSFKDARIAYGRQDPATNLFLQKLVRLGMVSKDGHGKYRRAEGGGVAV